MFVKDTTSVRLTSTEISNALGNGAREHWQDQWPCGICVHFGFESAALCPGVTQPFLLLVLVTGNGMSQEAHQLM